MVFRFISLVGLVGLGAVSWWFLRKRNTAQVAAAKALQRPATVDMADTQPADAHFDAEAATTSEQKWRRSSAQAVKQAERGEWQSYARTLQAMGDQLCDEGSSLEAINIYCRVLFVQINGPVDGAPFSGNGFVTDRVYDHVMEFCGVAGLDGAATRAKFIEAAGKIYRRAMPLSPAQAWEAVRVNRATLVEALRQQREARNTVRFSARDGGVSGPDTPA